jgi:DNA polymerase III alpha subunit
MGKHAGGLIVCNDRIDNFVPLVKGTDGSPVSAWVEGLHGQDLGPVGLIKFDLLVVSGLYQIACTVKLVKERHGLAKISATEDGWDWSDTSYLNDPLSIQIANKGDLKCIFQYDSEGIRNLVRKSGIDSFDDLVAIVSLYRPGPLQMKMDETFCKRKKGEEKYELHPILEPITGTTYGVLVYQEQIMMILNAVGKIPLRDCYQVIKAISKKKLGTFTKYKDQFIFTGQTLLGKTEKEMQDYWSQIEAFSGYGFNKSVTEDAIIYCVDGSKQIKNIRAGDKVYCVNEKGEQAQTEVVAVHDHGVIDVVEVTFDDGYSVKCTLDHKFLTEEGQVPLWKIIRDNLTVLSSPLGEQNTEGGVFKERGCDSIEAQYVMFSQRNRGNEEGVAGFTPDYAPISNTRNLVHRRVLRVVPVGKRQCYDLEVAVSTHNFILPNGIVTANSHSTAYSYISARQLYLKSHYPLEFYAATLMNEDGDEKKREYITEALNHGVAVEFLDLNKSKDNFAIVDNKIYLGFSNVKGIGEEKAKKIVELQPYKSFEDFLKRFGTDATVCRALIPLQVFKETSPEILYKYWLAFSDYQKGMKDRQKRFQISCDKMIADLYEILPQEMHKLKFLSREVFTVVKDYIEFKKPNNYGVILKCVADIEKKFVAAEIRFKNKEKELLESAPSLSSFDHAKIELDDKKVLELLANTDHAEQTYLGFVWRNKVRMSKDYASGFNFESIKDKSAKGKQAYYKVLAEVVTVNVKQFKNGSGQFASLELRDDNFEIARVTVWEEDYMRFKIELKKGNLISIQVVPSNTGYQGYTFNSPPKWQRHLIPKDKKLDYRLVLLDNAEG